jgi:predicted nucleic acid-binding protein
VARIEILMQARDGTELDELAQHIARVHSAPLDTSVARAAEVAMRTLAQKSTGAHRIPVVDYFVAAAAEAIGGAVLHYDHDYDRLAEVMEFESIWLAPPGSIP